MEGFVMIIPIIVLVFFFIIMFRLIAAKANSAAAQQNDLNSPEKTGEAAVVDKREGDYDLSGGKAYYVTFEDSVGSRMELNATQVQYSSVARGDRGTLTFRGRTLVSFTRTSSAYSSPAEPDTSGEVHLCPSCGATYKGSVCDYCGTPWHKE